MDVSLEIGQKNCVVIQGLDCVQNGYVVVEYFTGADICSGQEASVGAQKFA